MPVPTITGTVLSWAYASNNRWRDDVKGVKWESYGMRNGLPHEISIRCDSNSRTAGDHMYISIGLNYILRILKRVLVVQRTLLLLHGVE